jgi:hypothetical protein
MPFSAAPLAAAASRSATEAAEPPAVPECAEAVTRRAHDDRTKVRKSAVFVPFLLQTNA